MKKINLILPAIIFSIVIAIYQPAFAQEELPDLTAAAKAYLIQSSFNHKTYHLYVSVPKTYTKSDTVHYPVLYLLDGKFSFTSFYSIRQGLDLGKEIKDIILVAIADNGKTESDWIVERYNDFTPSSVPQSDVQWGKILHIPDGNLKSGGAELFLNTLQNDIIPFIDNHFKTTTDRGLSGHSLGGLLVGYCLMMKPGLFKRYGINSPSFWWNNNEMLEIENANAHLANTVSAKVFFSAGALEGDMMIRPLTAFIDKLKTLNYKGLTITSQIFEGESHLSVVPACSSRTLKILYSSVSK